MMIYLLTSPLWLPLLMLVLYAIGIQYQRESLPQWLRDVCLGVASLALVLDVLLNWTLFSLYLWELPRWKDGEIKPEYTFSDRLERLVLTNGWRGAVARPIALMLNWIAPPGHPHIHNAISK